MGTLVRVKLALLVVGGILLGYGIRADVSALRLVAIALFVAAFLTRFLDRGRHPRSDA